VPDISYPSIPDPNIDPGAMLNTLTRLKETVELMTGQTKDQRFSFPNQTRIIERRSATAQARFTEQLQIQATTLGGVVILTEQLEIDMYDSSGVVNVERQARIDEDGVLAGSITTVSTTASTALGLGNNATASGAVYLVARSPPGGASASYGWHIAAGDKFVGMEAIVDSVTGDAGIAFTAENFRLTDSGTAESVFEWDSGDNVFRFFVPVEMLTEDLAQNAVTNASSDVQTVSGGANFDIPITTLAGSPLVIIMSFSDPSPGTTVQSGLSTFSGSSSTFDIKYDGLPLDSIEAVHAVYARSGGGTFSTIMLPVTFVGRIESGVLAAGSHTIRVANPTGGNLKMAGVVLETKR
jgi:hypothetical protein